MHIISYSLLLPLFDYFPAITCNMKPSIMRYRVCKYLTLLEKLETGPFSKEVENKRIIVNRVLSFSWKHQLHLQIPETQAHQWNRNNSFQYASKNLITSNSWHLFTTVIWNINYDNVLTSFVTWFSEACHFSFWSWCNICFVTGDFLYLSFLFLFSEIYPEGIFLFFLCLLTIFLTFPIIIPPPPGLLIQEKGFSADADSWCCQQLNVMLCVLDTANSSSENFILWYQRASAVSEQEKSCLYLSLSSDHGFRRCLLGVCRYLALLNWWLNCFERAELLLC